MSLFSGSFMINKTKENNKQNDSSEAFKRKKQKLGNKSACICFSTSN